MEARALQRNGGRVAILALGCLAIALWSMSCGGTGTPETYPNLTPSFSLSSTNLDFANQVVGSASSPQLVTLTNASDATLNLSSVQVSGSNAGDFTLTDNCGSSLAPQTQCKLLVAFAPKAAGLRTASVVFTDNAAGSPQSLSLSGTGVVTPEVIISPASLSFGTQGVATTSTVRTITLTNDGNAALSISSLTIAGANASDFVEVSDTCGDLVPAGATCRIGVTFTPAAAGPRKATLDISDNASGSPQSLSLSGTGVVSPEATISPASLSFGTQGVATTSAVRTITLTNGGDAALSMSSLTIAGANASDFVEVADTCGDLVPAGATCRIGVTFTPTAAGPRNAALDISDNASGSPQAASFTGTGSPDIILSWGASPTSGVVGYNIYRGTVPGGEGSTPLNAMPVSGDSYVDENVIPGATYYYVLTAVGADGAQSARSNETEAVVPTS